MRKRRGFVESVGVPTIVAGLLFIAGPLLCLIRLIGWSDTFVFTSPSPLAIIAALIAGAVLGGWGGWMMFVHGRPYSVHRRLSVGITAFGWALIGFYLLGWGVEMAAFSGFPPAQERIEAPVTGKGHSGRGQSPWIGVRTRFSAFEARLRVPRALYDRADPESGNQCLIIPTETGRGGVVRARLDPPPELAPCRARPTAPS